MQSIADIAAKDEDAAVREFGLAQTEFSAQQEQLQNLMQYKEEYSNNFNSNKLSVSSSASLKNLHSFMAQLDHAINMQRQLVVQLNEEMEAKRQVWLDKRNRVRALGMVVDKYQAEENVREQRREQQENDEFSRRAKSNF